MSALTKPEDALARRDPKTMSGELWDRWYCSPYVQSIAYQLQEAIPHSHAEQIRQVAQNEGTVLSRIKGLMLLITLAALFASALAVSAAMATAIFERRREVGLMKALGAGNLAVAALFFAESTLLALMSGSDWILCRFLAGAPDRALDLRFPDHHRAGAVSDHHGDRCGRDLCRKRGGDSACREVRSRVCVTRRRMSNPIPSVAERRASAPHTSMFLRMLVRAAVLRRGRAASALLAMIVAAAVATAMMNLYVDVQAKLRKEFRSYGANIVVVGKDGTSLPADALQQIETALGGSRALRFRSRMLSPARRTDNRSW